VTARLAATDWRQLGQTPIRSGQIATWVVQWHGSDSGLDRGEILRRRKDWIEALAEAWEAARSEGLIAVLGVANPNPDAFFITRHGEEMLAEDDPVAALRARRRLGVELHPRLERRLRSLTRAGAFEQAAFDALRDVEVRVRDLAGDPRRPSNGGRLIGADLMRRAFKPAGPLSDPTADRGEQVGMMELFAGAFGAVRNPLGHGNVEWTDPTEAAEMVLLADLLMRQLDRIEQRLAP